MSTNIEEISSQKGLWGSERPKTSNSEPSWASQVPYRSKPIFPQTWLVMGGSDLTMKWIGQIASRVSPTLCGFPNAQASQIVIPNFKNTSFSNICSQTCCKAHRIPQFLSHLGPPSSTSASQPASQSASQPASHVWGSSLGSLSILGHLHYYFQLLVYACMGYLLSPWGRAFWFPIFPCWGRAFCPYGQPG